MLSTQKIVFNILLLLIVLTENFCMTLSEPTCRINFLYYKLKNLKNNYQEDLFTFCSPQKIINLYRTLVSHDKSKLRQDKH